jgi:hypothetical protein
MPVVSFTMVIRSCAGSYDSSLVHAADRYWDAPGISSDDLGLRCVR